METGTGITFSKILALLTAAAMLSAVLLAGIFIALEADHDCEGEDCPICICLEQCGAVLNQIGNAPVKGSAVLFSIVLLISSCFHTVRVIRRETPVTIKVRLND